MTSTSRLATAIILLTSLVSLASSATYTNKFDNINVDSILANSRILNGYIKCLLDEGPCTSEGRELKKMLPDALRTACSKCTEKQKLLGQKVILFMMKNKKKDWDRLSAKYDPKGEFQKRYSAEYAKLLKKN